MKRLVCLWIAMILFIYPFTSTSFEEVDAEETKLIAFTFDDGPSDHTARLLDGLKGCGAKVTFFVNGENGPSLGASKYAGTIRRIVTEGHQLANHTYAHRVPFDGLTGEEMKTEVDGVNNLIFAAHGGSYQPLVRTPGGALSNTIYDNVAAPIILWSLDTLDWKYRNADTVYNAIMSGASDGDIVLLHDIHGTSVDAALRAIPELQKQGYECVTVSELFARRGVALENGKYYTGAPNVGTTAAPFAAPVISAAFNAVSEKTRITLSCSTSGVTLYYTTDGSVPTLGSNRYTGSFDVPHGTKLTVAGFDKFAARTPLAARAPNMRYTGAFDAKYYADKYADVKKAFGYNEDRLLAHFLQNGIKEGRQASPAFSVKFYKAQYPDLKAAFGNDNRQYLEHYVTSGIKEGRQASDSFDPVFYRLRYADLRRVFGNDWRAYTLHFVGSGTKEKREGTGEHRMHNFQTVYNNIDYAAVYDYNDYVEKYPVLLADLLYDETAMLKNFVEQGIKNGRQGSSAFSVQSYYREYEDLRRMYGDNLPQYYYHFIRKGSSEGRHGTGCTTPVGYACIYKGVDYSAVYDFQYYTENHPEVRRAVGDDDEAALRHFVEKGMKKGLRGGKYFDPQIYKARYADVRETCGDNMKAYYEHYLSIGIKQGRVAR